MVIFPDLRLCVLAVFPVYPGCKKQQDCRLGISVQQLADKVFISLLMQVCILIIYGKFYHYKIWIFIQHILLDAVHAQIRIRSADPRVDDIQIYLRKAVLPPSGKIFYIRQLFIEHAVFCALCHLSFCNRTADKCRRHLFARTRPLQAGVQCLFILLPPGACELHLSGCNKAFSRHQSSCACRGKFCRNLNAGQ